MFLFALALSFIQSNASAANETVFDIGSRLQLFVDCERIEKMDGVALQLNRPVARETVLQFDKPWEGRYCGYMTVIAGNGRFRLYYRGNPQSGKDGSNTEVTCMAESRDGIQWNKPNLGLYEVNGTRENNVVLKDQAPFSHNFSPFIDVKPGIPEEERYKAVAGTSESGLAGFVSSDGLHWKKIQDEPLIKKGAFDSQNVVFWSENEQRYLCYLRTWTGGDFRNFRTVSRCTSPDFIHWSDPVPMTFGDTPTEHLYTNQTLPYFRAPDIYLAFPARFMPGRKVLTPDEAKEIGVELDYSSDCSETCFMSSRGGNRYVRTFMEGFIRPGVGAQNWSSRTNYTAYGLIPTGDSEISQFIQRNYGQPTHYLQRLTIRTDGFISVNAPYQGGELLTKPLKFEGDTLAMNYSTGASGSIQVEIQDENGAPIPGYSLIDCPEIIGDRIDGAARWKEKTKVADLAGKTIRLRFVMKDADLYSFQFKN